MVDSKDFYNQIYDPRSHDYGQVEGAISEPSRRERRLERVVRGYLNDLDVKPDARVVEIGASLGWNHRCHPRWEGFEYSATAVALARERFGQDLRIVEADARCLPIETATVDFLFTLATLEHVPMVDRAFEEIDRVLAPGGVAVVAPAWNCRSWTVKKLPQRPYRELKLAEKLQKALIPLGRSLPARVLRVMPARVIDELTLWAGKRPRFRFRPLEPDFSLFDRYPHISDDDAFVSMDAHTALAFFVARGYECPSHPTMLSRLACRGTPVVARRQGSLA